MSRQILRCGTFLVLSGCVVSAPWLGLSPVGLPPDPMFPGEGTFLSGRSFRTRTTVSCPLPPGRRPWPAGRKRPRPSVGAKVDNPPWRRPVVPDPLSLPPAAARRPGNDSAPADPVLMPCLMMRRGQVCLPGPSGPVRISDAHGGAVDPFDVLDRLRAHHSRIYLVDLDGIERNDAQLEYVQEFSRDVDLWVDTGVPTAEAAIDVLVAGAERAVLSSAALAGPQELKRAWRLSTDWVFEIELVGGGARTRRRYWESTEPLALAETARGIGLSDLVLSPREEEPDWNLVRALSAGGPTWINGTFTTGQKSRLAPSGAAGGIFHIDSLIADLIAPGSDPAVSDSSVAARDDED